MQIRSSASPRHVPSKVIVVKDIHDQFLDGLKKELMGKLWVIQVIK